ncbi:MAG TPA: PLP-dependent aspartate aminotransferase family protein [Candidatus Thermoplasmatota archaeon]|nr:PLP-dependent aspartate aminotransferase family protein [Candidatus Thermoplasmatota archaeon]
MTISNFVHELGFGTRSVHAGRRPDPTTGAVLAPIYQVTTFAQEAPGEHKGYAYSRTANPTVVALEERLADLEGGVGALAYGSGIAAVDAILRLCDAGDHVAIGETVYGGTIRLARDVLARHGVRASFVDLGDPGALERSFGERTRLVLSESPANPTLKVVDLAAVSRIAHAGGALHVVDNTFCTPYLQRPFDFGADAVVHSTTKYLDGHNATVGGAVVVRDDVALLERLRWLRNATGAIQSPFEAWLTLQGVKTLPLRLDRQCANAQRVAEFLAKRKDVARVLYPGLPDFSGRALVQRQQRRAGAVVSFEPRGGRDAAVAFLRALRLFTVAENLGSVESIATHPATMTHASVPPDERARRGITEGLVRLSVGVEDPEDLLADLSQALTVSCRREVAV